MKNIVQIISNRNILVMLLLGFASGLPLALSGSTLQAWFTTSGISLVSIGVVGLAAMPYTFKFLWAPVMDRFAPPFLGRRRGWMMICQVLLALATGAMAFYDPTANPTILWVLACVVAFLSASQDIAVDAYRADILTTEERALGAAMSVNGYRIAMLVSGGLALVLAHHWGWQITYLIMSGLTGIGMIATLMGKEPVMEAKAPKTLKDCTVEPLLEFLSRPSALYILLFIVCYKLGDAFAASLTQVFLIREIEMSLLEIGTLVKLLGFFGTLVGTLAGGVLVIKWGAYRSLFYFGLLQALGNLLYLPLLWTGPNYVLAGSAILADNICAGMGTAAFVGFLMSLCNHRFTAFQYALLSALSAVGRVFISPLSGWVAEVHGWHIYFLASVILSIPGLVLLWQLRYGIEKMSREQEKERTLVAEGT